MVHETQPKFDTSELWELKLCKTTDKEKQAQPITIFYFFDITTFKSQLIKLS